MTGGECTIYKNELSEIICYASETYNLLVRIITNGSWANTYNCAFKKIESWKNAGLSEINFSTGDDHLKFVPIKKIINAIYASVDCGLIPIVNIESSNSRSFTSEYFLKDLELVALINAEKVKIINGIWVPFKKDDSKINNANFHIQLNHQPCNNLFSTISIDPSHRMLACCGLTSKYIKFLDLGASNKESIKYLYENQFADFLKIWLFTDGPYKILQFISTYIDIDLDLYNNMHDCQICASIFNNRDNLEVLRTNYVNVYANIMLKYMIKIKN